MRLVPKNWREFQHYKDRSPPWIRLQRKLLDDREFHSLPVASRALAPMLWLLASEAVNGEFNGDPAELAFRLRSTEKEIGAALKPLIDKGFFIKVQVASTPLADRSQVAVPETEAETEALQRLATQVVDRAAVVVVPYKVPDCEYQAVVEAYASALPQLPQVAVLTDVRKSHINARWRDVCAAEKFTQAEAVAYFRDFFAHCAKSAFLTGKAPGKNGGVPFRATLDWLMNAQNFVKVIEDNYHRTRAA